MSFRYKSGIFCVIYQKVRVLLVQTGILAAYPEKFSSWDPLKFSRIRDCGDGCGMICKRPVWLEPEILKSWA